MTVRIRLLNVVAVALAAALAACARGGSGDACTIASDCEAGLVCTLEGACATFDEVRASFDVVQTVDVITLDTADAAGTGDAADAAGCRAVEGVFEAGDAPCDAAAEVRAVTSIALASEGHGLAQLATIANTVIADGFQSGAITLALHVDGDLGPGCAATLAWIRKPEDRNADCTAVFSDAMPFDIPNLVATQVDHATLSGVTTTGARLSGIIDKAALIASMDPALRDVAEQMIVLDVDTDGDQVPDKASAILDLGFARP